jgi:para-aminobenzoate synthetase
VHDAPDPERAFVALYGQSETAFWLDSAVVEGRSRFSFIGSAEGPLAATVAYDVNRGEVAVQTERGAEVRSETIFEYLAGEVGRLDVNCEALPFDFNGGWVGYFGYECKADCGGDNAHAASTPDAAFVFADRLIAFDLLTRCAYIVSVTAAGDETAGAAWIAETARRLGALAPPPRVGAAADRYLAEALALRRPRAEYLNDIAAVAERLADGDSYEVCLTNQIAGPLDCDPLVLYRRLRQVNPAPHCAFLRFGTTAVLSSSPERFLRIGSDGWVEARPVKGTAPRGATWHEDQRLADRLRCSEKDRAENLMIADLLRNDLGMVCAPGTVHAPELMVVESFETVHQLVSTVRGRLRAGMRAPDCIRACFPAGSMTGAPKRRTMQIIDELEGHARGVYSGALGYLGLGGGCDLAVVIRTIVMDAGTASLGVGGAIVAQSDPDDEFREVLLKAVAPLAAIDPGIDVNTIDGVRDGALGEPVAAAL